jgi:outer membrane biosynthesis protein TonB
MATNSYRVKASGKWTNGIGQTMDAIEGEMVVLTDGEYWSNQGRFWPAGAVVKDEAPKAPEPAPVAPAPAVKAAEPIPAPEAPEPVKHTPKPQPKKPALPSWNTRRK